MFANKAYIFELDLVTFGYDLSESLGDKASPVLKAAQARFTHLTTACKKQLESLNKLAEK